MSESNLEFVILGGTVVDQTGTRAADVRVVDGLVAEIGADLAPSAGATVLDAGGCIVTPGLVDLQVHFREPGREEAENVDTGARAAALGGCSAVVCMPNTEPPLDDAAVVQAVMERGRASACDVRVAGCITKRRAGLELAPLGELYDIGVRIFTDDGDCVADALVMRRAFEYSLALPGAVIAQHAEDPALVRGGHMHEGAWSARLGIPGRPAEAESSIVARDLALAKLTGGRYHVLHTSAGASAALVRAAKAEGVRVTAECTPQHLALTDESCQSFDPSFKMNPPLREQRDVDALRDALADGTIDAIATDHAPHAPETKDVPFEEAPPGMLGVETALAVVYTTLVEPGIVSLEHVLRALSWNPARIAGVAGAAPGAAGPGGLAGDGGHGGPVEVGRPAHLCVFDPAERWQVDSTRLASRSRNSPWEGWKLTGKVRHTLLRGVPTVRDGAATR